MKTHAELYLVILVMMLATLPFRLAPFVLYRKLKKSQLLKMLGKKLPPVMMLLLVLYALKDAIIAMDKDLLFQLMCLFLVGALQWKWRNVLFSIAAGLGLYLFLANTF